MNKNPPSEALLLSALVFRISILALIMVGSYTINIYTDNKYLDLLILIMVILFVCLFTYFVLYTNRVVRTVSTNYYWGNEYENQYI